MCSRKGCDQQGLISLSELCNVPYNGHDTPLRFCEDHVLDMLVRYQRFKDLEQDCDLVRHIRNPWSVFFLRQSDMKVHRLQTRLVEAHMYRMEFQSRITCNNSAGHDHWIQNIQTAAQYCDDRLWHLVTRRKKTYMS